MANTPKVKPRPKSSPRAERASVPKYATGRQKKVWLTFDDGPHPTNTDKVLKTLSDHKISATFFVIGENAKRRLKILRRIIDEGHRIGNHSFTHPHLPNLSEDEIREEILKTDRAIATHVGRDKLFRPPYGAHDAQVDRIVRDLGYRLVFWNVDTLDWDAHYQPHGWVQHGIEQIRLRDSSTILNHDIHKTTADHLAEFIERIIAIGNIVFGAASTL
jgi:peptidoglycan-N-acetylglucosamine deacetylase